VIGAWQREVFKSALLKMVTFNEMKRGGGGVNCIRQMR